MIKTNKLKKFNTSFAQNILSKYGIGRWKGQFTRLIYRNSSDMVWESGEGKALNYTEIKKYNTLLKVYKSINNSSSKIILPCITQTVSLRPSYDKHCNIINITTPTEIKLYSKTQTEKLIQKVTLNNINQEKKYSIQSLKGKTGLVSDGFTNKTDNVNTNIINKSTNSKETIIKETIIKETIKIATISKTTNSTATNSKETIIRATNSKTTNSKTNNNQHIYHITDIQNKENVIHNKTDTKLHETERIIQEARENTTYQNILEKEITYKKDFEKREVLREVAQKPIVSGNKHVGKNKLNTLVYNMLPTTKSLTDRFSETIEGSTISQTAIINKLITKGNYQHPESRELNSEWFNLKNGIPTHNIIHSTPKQQINRNILREHEIQETNLDEYEKNVHYLPQMNHRTDNLVFYKPQLKEKEQNEHGKKDIFPIDVMQAEKNVYAKATSTSKPDKKLQNIGSEEVKVLADKVFQILEKRLTIQKDRRGLR